MKEQRIEGQDREAERWRALAANYEARLIEMADLAAYVRHEVNNPLTGVLGQAQLLLRGNLDATMRRRVQTIEQLALRIRDTIAQLGKAERLSQPNEGAAPESRRRDKEPR